MADHVLTENEMKALVLLFRDWAECSREDIIGVLMKSGCFRVLPEQELVDFAKKIEAFGGKPFFSWRTEEGFTVPKAENRQGQGTKNNVYGHMICKEGLAAVHKVVNDNYASQGVHVTLREKRGLKTLLFDGENFCFESYPFHTSSDGKHLFNGWVDTDLEQVVSFVQDISGLLKSIGVQHNFEVYDNKDEIYKLIP